MAVELRDTIRSLVDYAISCSMIEDADRVWAYNAVLDALGLVGPGPCGARGADGDDSASSELTAPFDLEAALQELADAAVEAGSADDSIQGRDIASMRVMGALMPRPSEVASRFDRLARESGPKAATDWLYRLCCDAGYVRRAAIARNIKWLSPTEWGDLEITINLSKPEKDPRAIAAAGAAPADGEVYPACQLCIENEGYPGRTAVQAHGEHPARQNLRIVPIELGGERWGFQYSPYAYFNEHCIAMSAEHRPMHVDRSALNCLFDFVDLFPHYFIGSNADLPIVGGSILSHDHFQGGAHEFPMMRAEVAREFAVPGFPGVEGEVLAWPLTVLRLRSSERQTLVDCCVRIIDAWRAYTDEAAGVVARTPDGVPHNTVTPVVRRVTPDGVPGGSVYESYLALRCNITSEEHPLGVFHPHAELHHIKRENIGLIEVMGLAILPPRLKDELAAVEEKLVDEVAGSGSAGGSLAERLAADPRTSSHAAWVLDVLERRGSEISAETCAEVLRQEVGSVFGRVLADAGVFKWDEPGRRACDRFLESL